MLIEVPCKKISQNFPGLKLRDCCIEPRVTFKKFQSFCPLPVGNPSEDISQFQEFDDLIAYNGHDFLQPLYCSGWSGQKLFSNPKIKINQLVSKLSESNPN